MAAVTTTLPQCLWAAIAAVISTHCINLPPNKFPTWLVSFGNTTSVLMVADCAGVFDFIVRPQIYLFMPSFCSMEFTYLKAIHIVFIVSWFAALFYIVRLFIYATEAQNRDEPAREILTTQLILMQRKLWNIIGWPAM